jgi:methylated-DNA-[protein]-cysteine S-methyltransferase
MAMTAYMMMDSPIGELLVVGEAGGNGGVAVRSLSMSEQARAARVRPDWRLDRAAFADVRRQLDEYFAGERRAFDLRYATSGTAFQERVWAAVSAIPYGTTTTYGRLAEVVGAPRDRIRAVGAAVGANPLLILRPCHRVIGADGSLTGYAAGVERKHFLLTLEGALAPQLAI